VSGALILDAEGRVVAVWGHEITDDRVLPAARGPGGPAVTRRRPTPSRDVVPIAAVVLALLLVACDGPTDTPERRASADAVARLFLQRVAVADGDRGWSLIHPEDRAEWGSLDDYLAAASVADWSDFEVVSILVEYCDDGVWCFVCVDVASVPGIPPFLLAEEGYNNGLTVTDQQDCDSQLLVRFQRLFGNLDGVQFAPGRD
jgi:hypothetical protein